MYEAANDVIFCVRDPKFGSKKVNRNGTIRFYLSTSHDIFFLC